MPEGPEVRIMTDNLRYFLKNNLLTSVDICKESFRKKTSGFHQLILPTKVIDVRCKGKFGYICLDNDYYIGIGFGMTGGIRLDPPPNMPEKEKEKYIKHFSVAFRYQTPDQNNGVVYFNCVRNFASVCVMTNTEFITKLSKIGYSILDNELLTIDQVSKCLRKCNNKTICEALMDQSRLSGIGNYIKAESLYHTKTYPLALVKNLDDDHLYNLYLASRLVAEHAYDDGGASLYTYTGISGDKTDFKFKLSVYGRNTDPKGNKVDQIQTPDKRTTHWVPEVQTIGKLELSGPLVAVPENVKVNVNVNVNDNAKVKVPVKVPVKVNVKVPVKVKVKVKLPVKVKVNVNVNDLG